MIDIIFHFISGCSLRCSDGTRGSSPRWRLDNSSSWLEAGLGSLKLMGVGFTVVSVHWPRVQGPSLQVQCSSQL